MTANDNWLRLEDEQHEMEKSRDHAASVTPWAPVAYVPLRPLSDRERLDITIEEMEAELTELREMRDGMEP